jgi:hypothetical protein
MRTNRCTPLSVSRPGAGYRTLANGRSLPRPPASYSIGGIIASKKFQPFVRQIEAVETAIWLAEVATDAGKTAVMAMLLVWQTVNAIRDSGSQKFSRPFFGHHARHHDQRQAASLMPIA